MIPEDTSIRSTVWFFMCLTFLSLLFAGSFSCGTARSTFEEEEKKVPSPLPTSSYELSLQNRQYVGRSISAQLMRNVPVNMKRTWIDYLNLVANLLYSHVENKMESSVHVGVLDSMQMTTYSVPGGYLWITDGLLEKCRNEAELAAVLAHEIVHLKQQSVLPKLTRALWKQTLRTEDTGNFSLNQWLNEHEVGTESFRNRLDRIADVGLPIVRNHSFSLKEAKQADKRAVRLLENAGYDSTAVLRILKRIQSSPATLDSPHKAPEPRLESLRPFMEQRENTDGALLPKRFRKHIPS